MANGKEEEGVYKSDLWFAVEQINPSHSVISLSTVAILVYALLALDMLCNCILQQDYTESPSSHAFESPFLRQALYYISSVQVALPLFSCILITWQLSGTLLGRVGLWTVLLKEFRYFYIFGCIYVASGVVKVVLSEFGSKNKEMELDRAYYVYLTIVAVTQLSACLFYCAATQCLSKLCQRRWFSKQVLYDELKELLDE